MVSGPTSKSYDPVWEMVKAEASRDAADEPLLSSFLYASILSHKSFENTLAFVLANRLADETLLATQLIDVFNRTMRDHPEISLYARSDVQAVMERDPACTGFTHCILYYKVCAKREAEKWCRV